jgi:phosphate transport system permease protein
MNENEKSFTGRRRDRKTRPGVKVADRVARNLITLGGLGTVLAVSTVFVFLVYVAWPLFSSARVESSQVTDPPWQIRQEEPIHLSMDEYQLLGWAMFRDGSIQVFRSDTGEPVGELRRPLDGRALSAWSFNTDGDDVAFGFDDGEAQLGSIGIVISFLGENQVPEEVLDIPVGEAAMHDGALYAHPQPGQFRRHQFDVSMKPPVSLSTDPVRLLGHTVKDSGSVMIALTGENLAIYSVTEIRNFLTGAVTPSARRVDLPYKTRDDGRAPAYLMLSKLGDAAYLAWDDGFLRRYDTRQLDSPQLAETLDLAPGQGNRLTALGFLIGRTTLVSGDSHGQIRAWFGVPNERSPDGVKLTAAHDLGQAGVPVTALSGSARSRLLAAGFEDGRVRLYHVTAADLLIETAPAESADLPVQAIAIGAREDHLLAATPEHLLSWRVDRRYPAINVHSLFSKMWYEGYSEPRHMWQSSSGTDDFEPKYGLMPLIFGTLKATFYSLLFGLPIALLAAVFTSEFMNPRIKAKIKPLIEMMASLPSVVLGFMAALVIAPVVEHIVPGVLASFVLLPLTFMLGAYGWQLMPRAWALRFEKHRFALICLMVPVGLWAALKSGPLVESLLFAGDFKRWMDGQIGSGAGGWFILLMPLTAILTGLLVNRLLRERMRVWARSWSRAKAARMDALKFLAGLSCWVLITAGAAWALDAAGFDPRGEQAHHFLGTYVQRNAMVVGFIMGFAIIPIIYTLAEDALSSVPEHLRAASLGAGATPWQTAVRIVVPTAMSGLFSAAMIGLGRAVGETMIVLMAAGNTPVMQMNFFNGFRTLSANIAVELPEAPVGSTHYRVLFLAALALFIMTFVINTFAEIIRQRFRKRAYQL